MPIHIFIRLYFGKDGNIVIAKQVSYVQAHIIRIYTYKLVTALSASVPNINLAKRYTRLYLQNKPLGCIFFNALYIKKND